MTNFFSIMIYVTTFVALAVTVIFYGGIAINNKNISNSQTFANCSGQLKTCKVTSITFAILYWFVVSGLSESECLAGYAKLSTTCTQLGCTWIIFAVMSIVLSIFLGIAKRDSDAISIMGKLGSSGFLMGAIFLVISFLLKVG